ncbi:MAG: hypothetical protein EOM20_03790 [Spartobacteria bacterium]|nr:hypothetical protein [Spartobacteria bacterium]
MRIDGVTDWIQLRSDYEDDYVAMQRVLELLGYVTEKETVDDISRAIVEGVRDVLGYDRAGLFLWHENTRSFHGTYGTDLDGKTCDEHDLYWVADGWEATEKIMRGDIFIEEMLDQPPPREGEEHLKAYMVVLRFGPKIYGILSVDNRMSARLITERELRYLTLFSRILGNAVELTRIRMDLERKNRQLNEELQLAQFVQLGFLPRDYPCKDRLRIGKHYQTSTMLGGDLYDVFQFNARHVVMYVADVAGHGVSAALISAQLKIAMESIRKGLEDKFLAGKNNMPHPGHLLSSINGILIELIPEDTFITLACAILDLEEQRLSIASAGHPSPLFFEGHTRRCFPLSVNAGPAIGFIPGGQYDVETAQLHTGDKFMLFTDGLTEAMNEQAEEYGEDKLLDIFRKHAPEAPAVIVEKTMDSVFSHRGGRDMEDDCTLLVIEML